jgi:ABC-type multidrug transport system fused ATPase/permease subunit
VVQQNGGLEAPLLPSSLSQGQKQLFSLARAVLKRRVRTEKQRCQLTSPSTGKDMLTGGGVLLVDEVSSTVDAETERGMKTVIQQEFEEYTVVMVTHRLEMVKAFDRLVVMGQGVIVDEGRPQEMMSKQEGVLGQ